MAFADSLLDIQREFLDNNDRNIWNSSHKHAALGISLASALLWLESRLSSRPLLASLLFGLSRKVSSLVIQLIRKNHLKRQIVDKSSQLIQRLTEENILFKKYFKLIEDYEVVEDNGKRVANVLHMKNKFRSLCWNCFLAFRQTTADLRLGFAINGQLDDELNYLCCLPMEAFDRFLVEDNSQLSLSLLKSLMQLKRLQLSELFRRTVSLLSPICHNKDDKHVHKVCRHVISVFSQLIQECHLRYPELLREYNCAKTLWISCEKSLTSFRAARVMTAEEMENLNILNANRSLRKHLFATLNLLDHCDYLIEDGVNSREIRDNFRENLDKMSTEITCLSDLVIDLERMLKTEDLKEIDVKPVLSPVVDIRQSIASTADSKFEEYVVTDQVFEAYITDDSDPNCNELAAEDDCSLPNKPKTRKTETSVSLLSELKLALKSKALERKRREAQAMGLPFDPLSEESEEEEDSAEDNSSESEDKPMRSQFADNQSLYAQKTIGFESQLAAMAVQKAIMMAANSQAENFGDQSDEESSPV